MSKPLIVLASTSRHRRALIEQSRLAGAVTFAAPDCDEVVDDPEITPLELVELLSRRKAESLAARFPEALIVGSDQVVELDGEILGKPGSAARAIAQLERLAGREHLLLTGLCVHEPASGRSEVAVEVHRMRLSALTRGQLERYVALDAPLDCAGSYRVESAGVTLFEAMSGDDFTAIVGLPICRLGQLLRRFGVALPDLIG